MPQIERLLATVAVTARQVVISREDRDAAIRAAHAAGATYRAIAAAANLTPPAIHKIVNRP